MSLKKRLPTPFSPWWRLLASLGVVFALFHWLALAAGSDRGQAGIAEEALFRGYLFRHVREGRTFRQAALVASGPFVLVHLLLLATMPWPIALASVLLAALMSFPLAYLFELGGNTVWGPAILHWVAQGAVKVVIPAESVPVFPFVWIAASAIVPFLVFLARPRSLER